MIMGYPYGSLYEGMILNHSELQFDLNLWNQHNDVLCQMMMVMGYAQFTVYQVSTLKHLHYFSHE